MIRTLLIIAAAGLVLAVACFGGALALGGPELMRQGWSLSIRDDPWDRDDVIIMPVGPTETRTLEWSGGDSLELGLPADVVYTQAADTRLEMTGPVDLLDRIAVEDGRIGLGDGERVAIGRGHGRLSVTLAAPDVRRFTVHGSGDLDIRDYDQDTLEVSVNGSGDVTGQGRAREMTVTVRGSGEADLRNIESERAAISIHGSGGVDAAPTQAADVEVSGSGDVRLHGEPAQLTRNVRGSGEVHIRD